MRVIRMLGIGVVIGVLSYMYYQMHVDLITVGEVAVFIVLMWIWILPFMPARRRRRDMIVQILNDHPRDAYSAQALTDKLNDVERKRGITPCSTVREVIDSIYFLMSARRIRYSADRSRVTKR